MKNGTIVGAVITALVILVMVVSPSFRHRSDIPQWKTVKQLVIRKVHNQNIIDRAVMTKDGQELEVDKSIAWKSILELEPETLREAGKNDGLKFFFKSNTGKTRCVNLFNVDWSHDDPFTNTMNRAWKQAGGK